MLCVLADESCTRDTVAPAGLAIFLSLQVSPQYPDMEVSS